MLKFVRILGEGSRKPQLVWGASKGEFTFVITFIGAAYHASAKRVGAVAFDGTRMELGYHGRFVEAERACEEFWREHTQ